MNIHKYKCQQVNMVLNVHSNHKAYQGWGEGGMESGKREIAACWIIKVFLIELIIYTYHYTDTA